MTRLEIQALSPQDISETRFTCFLMQIEEKLKHQENDFVDENTYITRHTLEAAYTLAIACHSLISSILSDQVDYGFVDIRPPGHHCNGSQSLGYYFINNFVVAANKVIKEKNGKNSNAEWDINHGNGTETLT